MARFGTRRTIELVHPIHKHVAGPLVPALNASVQIQPGGIYIAQAPEGARAESLSYATDLGKQHVKI